MAVGRSLRLDDIIEQATERTGRQAALVPADILERARALCADVEALALTPIGRFLVGEDISRSLLNALVLGDVSRRDAVPPVPVIVIGGLPRTGTTFLHRLFAREPSVAFTNAVACLHPGRVATGSQTPLAAARARRAILTRFAPELVAAHAVPVLGPEECNVTFMSQFAAFQWGVYGSLPRFNEQLDLLDRRAVLRRHLAWVWTHLRGQDSAPPSAIVLKSPAYTMWGSELRELLPSAVQVEIRRDQREVSQSWIHLAVRIQALLLEGADERDAARCAEGVLERLGEAGSTAGATVTVSFDELRTNPAHVRSLILDAAGVQLPARSNRSIRRGLRWQSHSPPPREETT